MIKFNILPTTKRDEIVLHYEKSRFVAKKWQNKPYFQSWDSELEYIASCEVNSCKMDRNVCRKTRKNNNVETILAVAPLRNTPVVTTMSIIKSWVSTVRYINKDKIQRYTPLRYKNLQNTREPPVAHTSVNILYCPATKSFGDPHILTKILYQEWVNFFDHRPLKKN